MAIIYKNRDYNLIDHREFINNVYKNTLTNENETKPLSILAKLFSIINVDKNQSNRKRTHNSDSLQEEVS